MDKIFKSFSIDLKRLDEKKLDQGLLSVVFATMNVVDKDGDMSLPGFYGNQQVMMLPAHDWSHVPIGKGTTREEGNEAIADIAMNMDLQAAKDWLSAIKFDLKHGTPIQEYSYGFKVLEGGSRLGDHSGKNIRYLTPREDGTPGSKIWEVSPVLVGAGEKTRTVMAKENDGKSFCEEVETALAAADNLFERSKVLAALRAKDGRELSSTNKERLVTVADSLQKLAKEMLGLTAPVVVEPSAGEAAGRKELARMFKIRAGIK